MIFVIEFKTGIFVCASFKLHGMLGTIKPENEEYRDDGRQRDRDQTSGIQGYHNSTEHNVHNTDKT